MNLSYFISRKLQNRRNRSFSGTVSVVGIVSIAFSLAVMLVSFAILNGFQQTIREKLFTFGGHFQVRQFSVNNSFEENPVSLNTRLYKNYKKDLPAIKNIQQYSQKAGLLKTDTDLQGIIFKGISTDFDQSTFRENLTKGNFFSFPDSTESRQVIISQLIADKLRLHIGDSLIVYFIQEPPKGRRITVAGIYESDMEEFDANVILGDIRLLRNLNGWADTLTGGYEVFLKNFDDLEMAAYQIDQIRDYDLEVLPVTEKFHNVFDWLSLLGKNVSIFLALILIVASFNMISVLLILIMERTQMIGLLKALGATNAQIRNIFLWSASNLILKGLLWGNVVGLGFCTVQYYTKLIPLDRKNYYMSFVPIAFHWDIFLLLNLAAALLILLVLLLPTLVISRIEPVKAIRFD